MKLRRYIFLSLLLLIIIPSMLHGQDQRLTATKLADILSLMPATDNEQAMRLFDKLMALPDEGLSMVTNGVQPNGVADAVPSRHAISLLTHYATTSEQKRRIEKTYLVALDKSTNTEVKAYFMANLNLIGSNESVSALQKYIGDKELSDPAVTALQSIGSVEAAKVMSNSLSAQGPVVQARLIKTLGEMRYSPALATITTLAGSDVASIKKQALWSIALMADASSYPVLLQHAQKSGFKDDPSNATNALVEYMHQMTLKGNKSIVKEISSSLLASTLDATQQHYRLAGINGLIQSDPKGSVQFLIKERNRFDEGYRKEVLKMAISSASDESAVKQWQKEYKKSTGTEQADILHMLARVPAMQDVQETLLVPALLSKSIETRIAAAGEIGLLKSKANKTALVQYLVRSKETSEIESAKEAILQTADQTTLDQLVQQFENTGVPNKVAILEILAARRDTRHFDFIARETLSTDTSLKAAAFEALSGVAASNNAASLLKILSTTSSPSETKAVQRSLIAIVNSSSAAQINEAYRGQKIKLLPVLPYLGDTTALKKVQTIFNEGSDSEKEIAFQAFENWQSHEAARTLLAVRRNASLSKYHERAFKAFVSQVGRSSWPDDQKLLMVKEIMPLASNKKEKEIALQATGNIRTFLSLLFAADFLDDPEVSITASYTVMKIALPSSDAKPGLTGTEVRRVLEKVLEKLAGADSPYDRIDIQTYLQKMPFTKGFESIFNGKDLTGWQGLVGDPIARSKMTKAELAAKQKEADIRASKDWAVRSGTIHFEGEGFFNLCTTRHFGDFEMIVDWRVGKDGDSGLYLRGSPQVQIWDTGLIKNGAQVGSGGLYNNKEARSTPLVPADNPTNEWNTFFIRMIGNLVTVYLNGVLVVDQVPLENYWDKALPIFSSEAIELQAHNSDVSFRNMYVRDLDNKPYELSKEEKEQGFVSLFSGKDLDSWQGNKQDYVIEDNAIAIYPTKEGHGNLYTKNEYSDFVFRFQFQLTPGANNGLGIHAPLEGDAAYLGKEIQILDNESPVYSKLEIYQYHGSVYGVIPAKRGFLRPTGEWNEEEVYVKGDDIKVTLNGQIILQGNMKTASKNGTIDHKDHPGLGKHSGYIGFLGHGSVVKFRSIRIKDLKK